MSAAFQSVTCTVIEVLRGKDDTVIVEAWYWPLTTAQTGPMRFRFVVNGRDERWTQGRLLNEIRLGDLFWRSSASYMAWEPFGSCDAIGDVRHFRLVSEPQVLGPILI